MVGMLVSFFKNWIWLTITIVESLVFTIAFNYLAPKINEIYLVASTWKLPFVHVRYWHVFAFMIVIHYIGQFIQAVVPHIVNFTQNINHQDENY